MTSLARRLLAGETEAGDTDEPDDGGRELGRGELAALVALGLVLVVGTAGFAFVLPAAPSRVAKPSAGLIDKVSAWRWVVDHSPVPSGSNALGAWLIGVSTAMFLAYAGTVRLLWRRHGRAAVAIVATAAVSCLAMSVLALPTHTSDVYDYALFARVDTVHHGRAYEDFPDKYPNDPVYPFASHQYTGKIDNKLPAWTVFSMGVSTIAGDGPVANLMTYRLVLAALSIGSALLVVFILGRTRPHAVLAGSPFWPSTRSSPSTAPARPTR